MTGNGLTCTPASTARSTSPGTSSSTRSNSSASYGPLPSAYCLPLQLNQVFTNLLVNAAQAIEEHGHIIIRTGVDSDQAALWIEIEDSGQGMSPAVQKRIFEPFFTTKPVGEGTGLGLSISFNIIEKHQGRIEVRSAIGRGTTFRITLPIDGGRSPNRDA
jgi:two-component system NtrC family sensor kinase